MPDDDVEDRRLVRRLLRGDEEAFEEFFVSYFPGLYRFALARLRGDVQAAEDVAQATMSRAISRLQTWRGEATLFTWLCKLGRREIAAQLERQGRRREVALTEDDPAVRAALESLSARGASRELEQRDVVSLVQATLDALPSRYGDVLEWKYIDGLSIAEIAERLDLAPKGAESVLMRARQAFRDGFGFVLPSGLVKESG